MCGKVVCTKLRVKGVYDKVVYERVCVCVKEGVWQRADEAEEEEEEAAAAAAEEKAGCKIIKKNSTESCGAK